MNFPFVKGKEERRENGKEQSQQWGRTREERVD